MEPSRILYGFYMAQRQTDPFTEPMFASRFMIDRLIDNILINIWTWNIFAK